MLDLMFISTIVGPQMMFPYSSIGQTSVLYSMEMCAPPGFRKFFLIMPSIL